MAPRACQGTSAKTGERCTTAARPCRPYCGNCDPGVREAKGMRAAAQWAGARLRKANESAWQLLATPMGGAAERITAANKQLEQYTTRGAQIEID